MASKPANRPNMKPVETEIVVPKVSEQKPKSTAAKGISKAARANYRTSLLNTLMTDGRNTMVWKDLTADHIQEIITIPINDFPAKIASIFQFNEWETDLKEAIWVVLYVSCLKFAREAELTPAQISTFFSIYKSSIEKSSMFDILIEVVMEMVDVLTYFRTMIISHSGSVGEDWDIFGNREAKLCIDYAFSSLFQHFRLYKQFLSQDQELAEIVIVKALEVPVLEPMPLVEAMTKSQYEMELGLADNNKTEVSTGDDANPDREHHNISENVQDKSLLQTEVAKENPLDILSQDEVRRITADTINSLFSSVNQDYDSLFEDQKSRFMSQIAKFVNN